MFQGFSEETVDFLWGIRFQNEKSWFEEHRQQYQSCLWEPMQALARQVHAAMEGAYPALGLTCHVSRIYRDARRLHGNGPYKDHLWFSLRRQAEDWTDTPVFWFEITPEGYAYGMGCYSPKAGTMARFRARLDKNPAAFEPLARAFAAQSVFVQDAPEYARPKGNPGPLLTPWYNRKSISLTCSRPHDALLFSPELPRRLTEEYRLLMPLYGYFVTLGDDPEPRG